MREMTFTEFRKRASESLTEVEHGETIRIVRRGKAIADIVPVVDRDDVPSWKRPALRMKIEGASLTREVLDERYESRR